MTDKEQYKKVFSQIHASGSTKAEVMGMAGRNKTRHRAPWRMALIAAVLVCLMAVTVSAEYGYGKMVPYEGVQELVDDFYGPSDYSSGEAKEIMPEYATVSYYIPAWERVRADNDVVERMLTPYMESVGEKVKAGDYTLTVVAQAFDEPTGVGIMYLIMENPRGLSDYMVTENGEVWWPGGERFMLSGMGYRSYIIPEKTTDTQLHMACFFTYFEEFGNGKHELTLFDYSFEDGNRILLGQGTVKAPRIRYESELPGISAAKGDIQISPIGIQINVERMDHLKGGYDYPRCDNIHTIEICYKDETTYTVKSETVYNAMYALQNLSGKMVIYAFNRIVDTDAVESIVINGQIYEVTQ